MSRFLLDTCVVSEPLKKVPDEKLIHWWQKQDEFSLFLSVLVVGELEKGIQKLPNSPKRKDLLATLEEVIRQFDTRVLSIDTAVARHWGEIVATCENNGRPVPAIDGLIAATALVHELVLVTRNVDDFEPCGVETLNPFAM